jgi:hypothetical protein
MVSKVSFVMFVDKSTGPSRASQESNSADNAASMIGWSSSMAALVKAGRSRSSANCQLDSSL